MTASDLVTVSYELDRADAIKAGLSRYGTVTVPLDPAALTPDQRETLAALPVHFRDGRNVPFLKRAAANGKPIYSDSIGYQTPILEPTPAALATALDEYRATRLAHAAAKEAERAEVAAQTRARQIEAIHAYLSKPAQERIRVSARGDMIVPEFNTDRVDDSALLADLEAALAAARLLAEDHNAKLKHAAIERSRLDAERAAAKMQALDDFIAEHGSDVQRKRRAAKLMPDDEILDLVRDHEFAPLDHLPRYQRMKSSDFSHISPVQFEAEDATACTDAQFVEMEAIRSLVPSATVTLRQHTATYTDMDGDDANETKLGYHVSIPWRGWTLTREYAAD